MGTNRRGALFFASAARARIASKGLCPPAGSDAAGMALEGYSGYWWVCRTGGRAEPERWRTGLRARPAAAAQVLRCPAVPMNTAMHAEVGWGGVGWGGVGWGGVGITRTDSDTLRSLLCESRRVCSAAPAWSTNKQALIRSCASATRRVPRRVLCRVLSSTLVLRYLAARQARKASLCAPT